VGEVVLGAAEGRMVGDLVGAREGAVVVGFAEGYRVGVSEGSTVATSQYSITTCPSPSWWLSRNWAGNAE
jgi:hypothetical protein